MTESPPPGEPPQPPAAPDATGAPAEPPPSNQDLTVDSVISKPLMERMAESTGEPIGIVVEVRYRFAGGTEAARARVAALVREIDPAAPLLLTSTYVATRLTAPQIMRLVASDVPGARDGTPAPSETPALTPARAPRDAIHRIWPDFTTRALITRSIIATKCLAVHRAFDGTGRDVTWAVMDSGIDGGHAHFATHANLEHDLHRSFLGDGDDPLVDDAGHGTHVAGIVAGAQVAAGGAPLLAATWWRDDPMTTRSQPVQLHEVSGMAPHTRLVSCKVLRPDETGDTSALLAALEYVQEINRDGRDLRIHGVNISIGYPFDPAWFAPGLTPVCREVDRLVQMGVLVVVSAGNTGYGYALDPGKERFRLGFDMTINDPGNADLAVTVGSTSCDPHVTGVSYFSSKGPTGDGRMKPDLVAPGERVISAAAGALRGRAAAEVPGATYVENSGTSMSAPHVSGAAAGFLSVHREFIGRPADVKRVLTTTATDLGRARAFQGAGALDAMRAIQSV
jgi:subtilisin family serine protease